MLIVLGGSTYPVPRQEMDIPKGEGLTNRATNANPRRMSASITNISDTFMSAPHGVSLRRDDMIAVVGDKSPFHSLTRLRVLAPVNPVRPQPPHSADFAHTANRSPNSSATHAARARTSRAPNERHIFREIDHVDLFHLRIVHLPVAMHLE